MQGWPSQAPEPSWVDQLRAANMGRVQKVKRRPCTWRMWTLPPKLFEIPIAPLMITAAVPAGRVHGHLTSLQLAFILKPAQMRVMACRCSKPAPMHLEDVEPPLPAECVAIWQARCANQPPPQLPSRRRPALPPPGQQDHPNPPAASQQAMPVQQHYLGFT